MIIVRTTYEKNKNTKKITLKFENSKLSDKRYSS